MSRHDFNIVHGYNSCLIAMGTDNPFFIDLFLHDHHIPLRERQLISVLSNIVVESFYSSVKVCVCVLGQGGGGRVSECMLGCEVELFTYLSFALVAAGLFCWEGLGGPVMAPPAFNCWRLGGRKECVCGGEGGGEGGEGGEDYQ